jgi:D-alanyl-D-alanine endopeptidase (penicillin-binding protein 7)
LTALVVLDTAPNFNRVCTVDKVDQAGGAKLAASNGGAYKLKDLFSAMLVGSANNAAHALANMCTGLSTEAFIKKMNEKAKALGATNSVFVDSSGLSESNKTTAEDMAKIANAAFSTQIIREYTQQKQVVFSSLNRPIKKHTITSTSKPLMEDPSYLLLAGKTGLLNAYNYASSTKNPAGQYLITVVLGSPSQKDSPRSGFFCLRIQ